MRRLATLSLIFAAVALTAAAQLTITTKSPLPTALVGQTYPAVLLETSGDLGPIVFDFSPPGSGPFGFVVGPAQDSGLTTAGTFCYGTVGGGAPPSCFGNVTTVANTYNVAIQARSLSTGATVTKQFTLPVVQPLIITTTNLPAATANQPYSFQIVTTGGSGQLSWSIPPNVGTLPPGIGLNPTTGLLSGTAPGVNASYPFTVQVQDLVTQLTTTAQFTLIVGGGLSIVTTAIPNATLNQPYAFQLQGTGGPDLFWNLVQGQVLPPGFVLSSDGVISGFGIATGTFPFQVQLTSEETPGIATQTLTLYITLGPLGINEGALPNATQNSPYTTTLTGKGGIPPYTWSFDTPSPAGLSIDPNTGVITGTPVVPGVFSVPVTIHDSTGQTFSQAFTLSVGAGVSISTATVPNGSPGVSYSATLTATGGVLTYRWSVSVGTLPPGLTLTTTQNSTGVISGTPTTQGTYPFTIQVTDFVGGIATKAYTIRIGPGLVITTTSLPGGALAQPYSQILTSTGGVAPLNWTIASGTLPPGLTLNAGNGIISGTPTSAGNFAFDVLVTDASQGAGRKSFSIAITNPVTITTGNLTGTIVTAFSQTLAATGGTAPYTWSTSSGTLPTGLQLNTSTGVISGTPTAGGASVVTFVATDTNGLTGSKNITITIALPAVPPITITLGSGSQQVISMSIGTPYPVDITGFLTLTFASSVGGTDDMVRFTDGTRSLAYIIRANTTQAIFPTTTNPAIVTGTVAGVITITASLSASGQDITPVPAPTQVITTTTAVPVITSVTMSQITGGVSVVVSGYSNTREVSSGSFTFTVTSGNTLSQAQFTVALTTAFSAWFSNTAANATGGQFKLTIPFNVTQGSATAVNKVTVTLTNSKGVSTAVSSQ